LACGTHIVGSNVGGIPEVIGKENSFAIDSNFVDNVTNRIISIISENITPKPIPDDFKWVNTILKEIKVYYNILENKES